MSSCCQNTSNFKLPDDTGGHQVAQCSSPGQSQRGERDTSTNPKGCSLNHTFSWGNLNFCVAHRACVPPPSLHTLLFVRHEAALWRPDRQHVPGENHQHGEADGDLQPGRSEPRQGSVKNVTASLPKNTANFAPHFLESLLCTRACFEGPDNGK